MTRKLSDTTCLKEAVRRADKDRWMEAISERNEALKKSETRKLVKASPGARVLPSQFVQRIQRNSEGKIEGYKA